MISDAWLAYAETKAIREETVVLVASAENTTTADYTATVTMKSKTTGKELASFQVVQKNYYPEWIEVEGEQVEWAESFKISRYSDMSGAETKKGVFTFELSDNPAKGAYKVNNMFMADVYYNNNHMVTGQGGVYYADVEGNTLTVYMDGAVKSYGFNADLEVAYNADSKSFSIAETVKTYNYSNNRDAYIAEYAAAVKVDAPAEEGGALDKFVGTWTESFKYSSWSGAEECSGEVTVTLEGGKLYFQNMFNYTMYGTKYSGNYYGTLSEDGKTVTLTDAGDPHGMFGPASDIVLTVEGNTLVVSAPFSGVSDYVATNPDMNLGGETNPLDKFAGTWAETFEYSSWSGAETCTGEVTVTVEGDKLYFQNMFNYTMYSTKYSGNYYGTLSEDGKTIALTDAGSPHGMFGPSSSLVLTVEGNTLKVSAPFNGVSNYVATNPNM